MTRGATCTNELLISSGFTQCNACKSCGGTVVDYTNPGNKGLLVKLWPSGAYKIYVNGAQRESGSITPDDDSQLRISLGKV